MEFEIIENGEYVTYTRHGDCNKCGACCCKNVIGVSGSSRAGVHPSDDDDDDDDDDLSLWEGYSRIKARKMWWWWKFDVKDKLQEKPCVHLEGNICSVYNSADEFPMCCEFFPVHPRDIEKFPECGFWFEKEEGDDRTT